MTNEQLVLLTFLIREYENMAVMLAYYYEDARKARIVQCYALPSGIAYIQYLMAY